MSERVLSMIPLAASCFLLTGAIASGMSRDMTMACIPSITENRRSADFTSPFMRPDITMRLISPSQSQSPRSQADGVTPRSS
jgi:hypothetical protein